MDLLWHCTSVHICIHEHEFFFLKMFVQVLSMLNNCVSLCAECSLISTYIISITAMMADTARSGRKAWSMIQLLVRHQYSTGKLERAGITFVSASGMYLQVHIRAVTESVTMQKLSFNANQNRCSKWQKVRQHRFLMSASAKRAMLVKLVVLAVCVVANCMSKVLCIWQHVFSKRIDCMWFHLLVSVALSFGAKWIDRHKTKESFGKMQ